MTSSLKTASPHRASFFSPSCSMFRIMRAVGDMVLSISCDVKFKRLTPVCCETFRWFRIMRVMETAEILSCCVSVFRMLLASPSATSSHTSMRVSWLLMKISRYDLIPFSARSLPKMITWL